MVAMRNIFIIILATTGLAMPFADSETRDTIEARDTQWTCKNTEGNRVISQNAAERAMNAAPFSDGKSMSSYPHWFRNGYSAQGTPRKNPKKPKGQKGNKNPGGPQETSDSAPIKFGVPECDKISIPPKEGMKPGLRHSTGTAKDDLYLLEFPVFADGHLYDYDMAKFKTGKEDPGMARVIFVWPSKTFCGIVAHTQGNQGNLVLCEH